MSNRRPADSFSVFNLIVRPARAFEFDMPELDQQWNFTDAKKSSKLA